MTGSKLNSGRLWRMAANLKNTWPAWALLIGNLFWLTPSQAQSPAQEDLTSFAIQRLAQAVIDYSAQIKYCRQQEIVLPPDTFAGLEISRDEQIAALAYFRNKNDRTCLGQVEEEFLQATLLAREAKLPAYSAKDDPGAEQILTALLSRTLALKRERPYLRLAPALRRQLEALPVLQHNFDPFQSIRSLGLSNSDIDDD
ncbi:hypothetical protein [Chromobacterium sp.]|uniref:hypothetical protein n=1 Tax=Chromobacterium sp. TaxID=306190 RepID=UPI0035B3860E